MNTRIKIFVCAFAAAFLVAAFSSCTKNSALAIPDLFPRAGDTVSAEFLKAESTIRNLRAEIAKHPDELKNYIELAQIYIQEARVSGRHHDYFPVAESILNEIFRRSPDNFEANVLRAGIMMTKHQFAAAKETIEKAIAKNPYNSGAYGVLCDANVELGNYDQAVQAAGTMMNVRPDLRSYARVSYLRELNGDRDGAIEAMKLAADAGAYGQENREWALYNLGNLFLNWGKLDTAQFIYNGILEERPNYAYAMSGLAMVYAAKKNYGEAIGLLVKASQTLPEHIFIEQLADLYQAMGQTESAHQMEQKTLDAFALHENDGWNTDREYAAFCLNHNLNIKESLVRAEKQYRLRPNNTDAADTYAWALYKSARANEAIPYIEQALRMKSINPNVHYHAGMIYSRAGNTEKASNELKLALDGSQLPPVAAQEAYANYMAMNKTAEAK